MFAVSQIARLAPLRSSTSKKRPERRGARAMRVVVHANSESDDTPRVTRRVLGVGSAALSAAFAKGLSFPTPAEAKEIVSGYKPLDGYDVRPPRRRQDTHASRRSDKNPSSGKINNAFSSFPMHVFELSYAPDPSHPDRPSFFPSPPDRSRT